MSVLNVLRVMSPLSHQTKAASASHWGTNWKKRMVCRRHKYSSLQGSLLSKETVCAPPSEPGSAGCWVPSMTPHRVRGAASNSHRTPGRVSPIEDLLIISQGEQLRGRTWPSSSWPHNVYLFINSIDEKKKESHLNSCHFRKVCQCRFFVDLRWSSTCFNPENHHTPGH